MEEPSRWWGYCNGQPILREDSRPAGYYLRPRTRLATGPLFEEEFIPLELVNDIRARVKGWRERGYPGTPRVTQELFTYWSLAHREREFFFCQREAVETIIRLVKAPATKRMGLEILLDLPGEEDRAKGYAGLRRYECKMATGTGKTAVMGMLAALNRSAMRIEPDTESGEPPLTPIIERFRPVGPTGEVPFRTVRPCHGTTKTHVSQVAEHSQWEHSVALYLETSPDVISYVKNDHLDLVIPYELYGARLDYLPTYPIRLQCSLFLARPTQRFVAPGFSLTKVGP